MSVYHKEALLTNIHTPCTNTFAQYSSFNHFFYRKLNLTEVFKDVKSNVIGGLIQKYEMDFKLCEYEETLKELRNLL